MDIGHVAAFWVVSMLFVITPGLDWAYVIDAGLRRSNVPVAVAGLLGGHLLATVAVAAGIAAVLAGAPLVLAGVTVAGAAYLIWMGVRGWLHPAEPHATAGADASEAASWLGVLAKGFGVSGLNPKVFLLFLALLPQFTDRDSFWPVGVQILCLGLVHIANCGVVYLLIGSGARLVLRARPSAARAVSRFSAAAMVAIGAALLIEQAVI
ncbi:LysE family translocator [Nocardioides sp. YR527]|uniref:LysE family translocator n=1 Tax=Nocardioides sp. YR527 TaxID=1881028 RepID=UPI001C409ECE|nr:LysE family transporter [Nocardioides sp. YR527]